jgi:hypothetical protein
VRFDGGRLHPSFDLNGSRPRGPTQIVRAAFDPVMPPTEPVIVDLLRRCLLVCRVANSGFTITNQFGDEDVVDYGASVEQWTVKCETLLTKAMERPDEP